MAISIDKIEIEIENPRRHLASMVDDWPRDQAERKKENIGRFIWHLDHRRT